MVMGNLLAKHLGYCADGPPTEEILKTKIAQYPKIDQALIDKTKKALEHYFTMLGTVQ